MFTSHELHRIAAPTPDAYDGSWLELLENPEATLPNRDACGNSEGPIFDAGSGPATPGG
jgi:hypothetical protein